MNIIIVGYGAMGKRLEEKLLEAGHRIVGIVSLGGIEHIDQIEDSCDLIIDFSHPNNLAMILDYATTHKTPVVFATTGYTEKQIASIYEASTQIPIVYTANFSLGVTVFEEVLRQISPILSDGFDIEIIEKHHNQKIDAPSGTAKMLLQTINKAEEYAVVHGREGTHKRGKEIGVHAIRGGSIVGEHSVIFAGEDEVFEIKHEAHSKLIFVRGAIVAGIFVVKQKPGIYTMHDVLFSEK